MNKRYCNLPNSKPKRLRVYCNPLSKPLKEFKLIPYIGEIESPNLHIHETFEVTRELPEYFAPSKDCEKRVFFKTDLSKSSSCGVPRIDLYVYAIEANTETNTQFAKRNHISLSKLKTPIERFYAELWNEGSREYLINLPFMNDPFENAISVNKNPPHLFAKCPTAIDEPSLTLHTQPPPPQHFLSQDAQYVLETDEPIHFFDAIFRKYEFMTVLNESKRYPKQKNFDQAPYNYPYPTYEELRCFIGLLVWTSLAPFPNPRSYFMDSEIYKLPHFIKHTTRDRFEQLLTILHLSNNDQIPESMLTAERYEAK